MKQVCLKVDPEGRIRIPTRIRKELGNAILLTKTSAGYLLISEKNNSFIEQFRKTIISEPRRRGKPRLPSVEEMKVIWKSKRDRLA
jgi:DNA-binding transcriptional regulator/RsmH inhibitor MraZ